MPSIRQLNATLINKIAAGEVIVRPASAVKELVENSLDAGATRIEVEVDKDCRSLRVSDDGAGMAGDDVALSVLRHATSKIAEFEDLSHLSTRGFRGEALASIVAVSRFELRTRPADAVAGARLTAEGGGEGRIGAAGCPPGTTVEVRDLFFNTPARLKFMKSPASEWGQIQQTLTRQALAAPHIGFRVIYAGRPSWEAPPGQSLRERVIQLLGRRSGEAMLEVAQDSHGVRYFGYINKPHDDRADRTRQYFIVNGRPVVSQRLSAILQGAFKGLIMTRRFPVAVLRIDLPPDEVDVNVHPTKEEVRFHDENKVGGLLHRALTETLRAANYVPSFAAPGQRKDDGAAPPPDPTLELLWGNKKVKVDSTWPPQDGAATDRTDRSDRSDKSDLSDKSDEPAFVSPVPPSSRFVASSAAPESIPSIAPSSPPTPYVMPPNAFDAPGDPLFPEGVRPVALGQVGEAYILAALGDDMLIIDQHAAHERLLYQQFKESTRRRDTQPLMIPIELQASPQEAAALEALLGPFRDLGIEIEHFGGTDYVVQAVPADLVDLDITAVVRDLLDAHEGQGKLDAEETARDRIVTRMACRAAVKAGQRLGREEMQRLIDDFIDADLPYTCPHGRPTMILMTRDQLDHQFKRK